MRRMVVDCSAHTVAFKLPWTRLPSAKMRKDTSDGLINAFLRDVTTGFDVEQSKKEMYSIKLDLKITA